MKDYYAVLGVAKDASEKDIKNAYRTLAKKYHPDVYDGDKEEGANKFKEVQEAYSVLIDPNKRAVHDNGGESGSLFDIFNNMRPPAGFTNPPMKGQAIQKDVKLTLEEMANGTTKKIKFSYKDNCEECKDNPGLKSGCKRDECSACGGKGRVSQRGGTNGVIFIQETTCYNCKGLGKTASDKDKCEKCKGYGFVDRRSKINFDVPKGIPNHGVLVIRGEGNVGLNSGPRGDVLVRVIQEKHNIFTRHDLDLVIEYPISLGKAILGGKIEVPTIYGDVVEVDVPDGSSDGSVIKKDNLGMQSIQSNFMGSMVIILRIIVPKLENNKEYIDLFEKLENVNYADKRLDGIKEYLENSLCSIKK